MSEKRDIRLYLQDILESIEQIQSYIHGLSEDGFYQNQQKQDAVLRRLTVIGEAVNNLPANRLQVHQDIPWRDIVDARNVFMHEYYNVRLDQIWQAVKEDLPKLKQATTQILEEIEAEE